MCVCVQLKGFYLGLQNGMVSPEPKEQITGLLACFLGLKVFKDTQIGDDTNSTINNCSSSFLVLRVHTMVSVRKYHLELLHFSTLLHFSKPWIFWRIRFNFFMLSDSLRCRYSLPDQILLKTDYQVHTEYMTFFSC